MSLTITAAVAAALAIGWILYRAGPIIFGRARKSDTADKRLARWNSFIVPLLDKMLDADLTIARGHSFRSEADEKTYTLATWTMVPSVLPDTDFVALARPDAEDARPEVIAVASSEALRALMGEKAHEQDMWGHVTWLHIWPDEIDLDAVVAKLTPVAQFRATHGFDAGASDA